MGYLGFLYTLARGGGRKNAAKALLLPDPAALRLALGGGGGAEWATVSGAAPLALPNAVEKAIARLIQYGKVEQGETPTPSEPVDIVCNNGALKYSANMANVNEQTARVGYYINTQGAVLADSYNWYYQRFIPVKPNTTYTLSMSQPVYYVTISEYSTAENSGFIVRKTGTTGSNTSLTITTGPSTNFIRFGSNLNRVVVTMEMVLAINWMLNIGDTAMDYQPYVEGGIYTDGEDEVLTVGGQNLVDLTSVTDGYYYDTSGVYSVADNARLTDYIPVRAGQKYTVYAQAAQSGSGVNVRCNLFDAGKVWKSQSVFVVAAGNSAVSTITPSENGFLRVSANYAGTGAKVDWSTFQIVRGEYTLATMPPYEPYVQPQTVTGIPMLLGVGNYQDEAELIHGIKTGRVGVKVFKGAEDERWTLGNKGTAVTYFYNAMGLHASAENELLCTLFGVSARNAPAVNKVCIRLNRNGIMFGFPYGTTKDEFLTLLAAQYAAGTPVIVLYPMESEITERVAAQPLHTAAGNNVINATAAVGGVELEAEYAARKQ